MEKLKRGRVFSCIQYIHGIRLRAYRVGVRVLRATMSNFAFRCMDPPPKKKPQKRKKKTFKLLGTP